MGRQRRTIYTVSHQSIALRYFKSLQSRKKATKQKGVIKIEYAADLAKALNNIKILDNLRDGLPYPYTEDNAKEFISAMINADKQDTFAFAIVISGKCIGSIRCVQTK